MHEDSDLRKLYLAFAAFGSDPQIGPTLGELISSLGAQLYPVGREQIGEFSVGEVTYAVDLSDRFGRACVFGGGQERDELDLFLSLCDAGSVVWDIGANFGLYGVAAAAKAGPSGTAFAVEPNARAVRLLEGNIARNASGAPLRLYTCAVTDFDGDAPFYEAEETVFSGLSDTHRSEIAKQTTVAVRRFDSLWRETGNRPVDLVKIDVEGHEADVLAGAGEAIAASPNLVIQFEVSAKNLDDSRRLKLIAVLRGLQADGMALWYLDSVHGTLVQAPLIENDLPEQVTGNLFMTRRGSDREKRLACFATRLTRRPPRLSTELEEAMAVTVQKIIERYKTWLSKEISNASRLNQELEVVRLGRTRPPLGLRFRPSTLAKVDSTTAIIRVTADNQDVARAVEDAIAFCYGQPVRVIVADGRTSNRPLAPVDGADLISPALDSANRYERATQAAISAADTSHILLLDADGTLQGNLQHAIDHWRREAVRGHRLAGLAFASVTNNGDAQPMQEYTLGGMLAVRYGLIAVEALRALDPQPLFFAGDGFDLDLSLRLWHSGFLLAENPASIYFRTTRAEQQRPVHHEDDRRRLEDKWAGIFAHPEAPGLFRDGGLRPVKDGHNPTLESHPEP